ncbi:MAG: carboxypeptidase-like regulatory domain-containing protein [Bacillota bacterium]
MKNFRFFHLLFFALIPLMFIRGQNSISGYVTDEVSKRPLSNVNVYLSNTMSGAVTDSNGHYKIQFARSGNYEIIASILGYEVAVKNIDLESRRDIKIDFQLKAKEYQLENISVTAEHPEVWLENYNIFRKLFIGKTQFAGDCIIENKEVIDFNWEGADLLRAKAEKPIIVINRALGFRVECILTRFEWNKKDMSLCYVIKPRFTLLNTDNDSETERWKLNRQTSYERSVEYFMLSLIRNDFWKKGYSIAWDSTPGLSTGSVSNVRVSVEDLLKKNEQQEEYILSFPGYLMVRDNGNISWLKLLYPEVTLNKNGFAKEVLPFRTLGYWSTLGVANMLPLDYNFSADSE